MTRSARKKIQSIRKRIFGLYSVILIAFCAMSGVTLYLAWLWDLEEEKKGLLRNAYSASALIQSSLTDASKILDNSRISVEKRFLEGNLGREEAHHIIRKVMEEFSIFNTSEALGLLLYVDRDGKLVAQSGEYPTPAYDLSDRSYYLDLKKDPTRKFSLGKLRVTATTGKWAFHLAMPVHGAAEEFEGLVTIQVQEKDLLVILEKILKEIDATILVQLPCGDTAFLFPSPPSTSLPSAAPPDPLNGLLAGLIETHGGTEGCFRIPASRGISKATWIAYTRDPIFGLISSARISESRILHHYLKKHCTLFAIFLLSIVIISGLFVLVFRKTLGLEQSESDASLDHLTRIRNRRSLDRELKRLWLDALRSGKPITLLFMDLDHFKAFNNAHGHPAGDRALRAAARFIDLSMQRPLDLCARWGGEEFLAVLPETTAEEAITVAERIRKRIEFMNLKMKGIPLPKISISIGIACSDDCEADLIDDLIKKADVALHQAKAGGRNRTAIYQRGEDPLENAPFLPGMVEQRL